MAGTARAARAVFDQFLLDNQSKIKDFPDSGVIVWTISMDIKKAKDWVDSAEGHNYKISALKDEETE
jgi:hypothetical protein